MDHEPGVLDFGQPLSDHPDNAGVGFAFVGLPGLISRNWPDLARRAQGTFGTSSTIYPTFKAQAGLHSQWSLDFTPSGTNFGTILIKSPDPTGFYRTYAVWVKSTQSSTLRYLFDTDNRRILAWNSTTTGQLAFNDGAWKNFGAAPNDGLWHRLVFVISNTAFARVYIDGVQLGSDLTPSVGLSTGANIRLMSHIAGTSGDQGHVTAEIAYPIYLIRAVDRGWVLRDLQWSRDPATDPRLRRWTPKTYGEVSGGTSYSGTSTLATEILTGDGAGTHTAPTYSGSGTLATDIMTGAGSGTHTVPTYSGSGTPSTEVATITGNGTHTAPTYSGSGTLAAEIATIAGTGTHTVPTYSGSGTLNTETITATGTGTHTAPTYSGSGALAFEALLEAATGLFTVPTYTTTPTLTVEELLPDVEAEFTYPGYAGSGALATDAATGSGSGTHTVPTYTGSTSLDLQELTVAGVGLSAAYIGTGTFSLDDLVFAATGTYAVPTYTSSVALLLLDLTGSAAGTHTVPSYTGSGDLACFNTTITGDATYVLLDYNGTGSLTVDAPVLSGAGEITVTYFFADVSLTFEVLDSATLSIYRVDVIGIKSFPVSNDEFLSRTPSSLRLYKTSGRVLGFACGRAGTITFSFDGYNFMTKAMTAGQIYRTRKRVTHIKMKASTAVVYMIESRKR